MFGEELSSRSTWDSASKACLTQGATIVTVPNHIVQGKACVPRTYMWALCCVSIIKNIYFSFFLKQHSLLPCYPTAVFMCGWGLPQNPRLSLGGLNLDYSAIPTGPLENRWTTNKIKARYCFVNSRMKKQTNE